MSSISKMQLEETPEEKKIRLRHKAANRSRQRKREKELLSRKAQLGI
jgi:hypothetical protein